MEENVLHIMIKFKRFVQNILVGCMKKSKVIIAVVLIGIISLTAYVYFRKQPVESVPNRATLVLNLQNFIEKEVVINNEFKIQTTKEPTVK